MCIDDAQELLYNGLRGLMFFAEPPFLSFTDK